MQIPAHPLPYQNVCMGGPGACVSEDENKWPSSTSLCRWRQQTRACLRSHSGAKTRIYVSWTWLRVGVGRCNQMPEPPVLKAPCSQVSFPAGPASSQVPAAAFLLGFPRL